MQANRPAFGDSQFLTVPKLYRMSVTMSSHFYRLGYYELIFLKKHSAVRNNQLGYEADENKVTPVMIEAGCAN